MTTTPAPSFNVVLPSGSAAGPWPTGFKYGAAEDVRVGIEAGGVTAWLTAGSGYTLTGATPTVDGGQVTLAPGSVPAGGWGAGGVTRRVIIQRRTVRRQGLALPDAEGHKPRATEAALDKSMRLHEEAATTLERSVTTPLGDPGLELPPLAERLATAGMPLAWSVGGGFAALPPLTYATLENLVVSTITALATVALPVPGQVADVTEGGRAGRFVYEAANLSAQVAADPYKGVTVPPVLAPSGEAGAWVRQITPGQPWMAVWFGVNPVGTNNDVYYNSIAALIPSGTELIVPAFPHTASNPIVFPPGKTVHIRGADRLTSHIMANPATLTNFTVAGAKANSLLQLCGSGSSARGLALTGPVNNVGSGEPAALTLGKYLYRDAGNNAVFGAQDRMVADDITVNGGSAGIRACLYLVAKGTAVGVAGADVGSHRWADYDALTNCTVSNCTITADRVGIEYYGCVRGRDQNNRISITGNAPAGVFLAGIRVLGAIGLISTGTEATYAVERAVSDGPAMGLFIAEAGFNDRLFTPANERVEVFGFTSVNANRPNVVASAAYYVGGTYNLGTHAWSGGAYVGGDVYIDGITSLNPLTSTQNVYVFSWEHSGNFPAKLEKLVVRNLTARGGVALCRIQNPIKHMILDTWDWTENAVTDTGGIPIFSIQNFRTLVSLLGGHGLHEISNVRMRTKSLTYGDFNFGGYEANSKIFITRCWGSVEGAAAGAQIRLLGSTEAGAKIITDGATEQDLATAAPITPGLNYRYPTGVWARAA